MRLIFMSVAIAGYATGALAQSGPTTLAMSCAQARGIVAAQGAAVLRTGPMTYDRYVRGSGFCALQETAQPAWVRTADVVQCPVGAVCRSVEKDNGR
ncbi:hypothetical protein IC232_23245 [Microvirga sp. BT688]|uniref:hypothetical protein n=1 Tax=Microvirga sp. TaxID=1873136 RepID=UPI0016850E5B|nr:hypothetical protein [Microvirga sp.]MBD2749599.1 hypothetical protein [Microvirga sp.]